MLLEVVWLLFLILVMVVSSGLVAGVLERMAGEFKSRKLLLGMALVGVSTSLPELFVGLSSSLRGEPVMALGNVVGANLANIGLIIGGAAVVFGVVPVIGDYFRKELWLAIGVVMMPFILISDGELSRLDGLLLIVCYLLYLVDLSRGGEVLRQVKLSGGRQGKFLGHSKTALTDMFQLLVGVVLLSISSWGALGIVHGISRFLGVGSFWSGLVIVGIGTTLPELVFVIMALRKKKISLVLGDIFGSVVVNSTLVLGVVAMINPIVYRDRLQRGISGIFLIAVMGLFWLFTKSKHKLERWEGVVLVGFYIMFLGLVMYFG